MKIFIWVGCLVSYLLVSVIIDSLLMPLGIRLGWLLRFLLLTATVALAKTLCNKRDNHKTGKCSWQTAMEKVAESDMSVNEYAKQGLTEDFLLGLPKLTYENMKSVLKAKVCKGEITEAQYVILLKKLSWTPGKDEFPKL